MIELVTGNCLKNSDTDRYICHVVNNKGGFGKGFAYGIGEQYPKVKLDYQEWYGYSTLYFNSKFKLGANRITRVDNNLSFIHMLAQNGYSSTKNPVVIDYNALTICLQQVNMLKDDKEIWMPKIGSGLAGGDWSIIEKIITETLVDKQVKIFNFKQQEDNE